MWAGKPAGMPMNPMGLMGTIIGGLFILFGAFFMLSAIGSGNVFAIVFSLIWCSIVAFHLYTFSGMLLGPSRQVYAITDQRGLIVESSRGTRMASLEPEKLRSFELTRKGKLATFKFGPSSSPFMMQPTLKTPLNAFHLVPDSKTVEKHIQNLGRS